MDDSVKAILALSVLFLTSMVGLAPAVIAAQRGRSFVLWWAFGTAMIPIALPLAFALRKPSSAVD